MKNNTQAIIVNEDVQTQELEPEEVLVKFKYLPLFQYISEVNTNHCLEFACCRLRTIEQLKDIKYQYQSTYSSASAAGKRVIFHYLRILNYRISRFELDRRRFN